MLKDNGGMKKLLILLVLSVLLAYSVSAASARTISGFAITPTCEADGSAKILVENFLEEDLPVTNLEFKYNFKESRFSKTSPLEGSWKVDAIPRKSQAYFEAPVGSLQYKGNYNFILEDNDCDRLSCTTQAAIECLGATRETICEAKEKIIIESCGLVDETFKAVITKVGIGLDKLELYDLNYNFFGEQTTYSYLAQNLPKDAKLVQIGEDKYEFSFTPLGSIKRAEITSLVCKETAFKTCTDTVTVQEEEVEEIEEVVQETIPEPVEVKDDLTAKVVIVLFFIILAIFIIVQVINNFKKKD